MASLAGGGSVINSNPAFSSVLTVSPTGTANTFSGMIQGGGTLGTLALVLNGNGTEVLSGANSYLGRTTVAAGTLIVTSPAALPDSGGLTIGAGSSLIFDSSASGASLALAVPEPGTIALLIVTGIAAALLSKREKQ